MNFLDYESPWSHTIVENVFSINNYRLMTGVARQLLPVWDYTGDPSVKRMISFDVNGKSCDVRPDEQLGPLLVASIENIFSRALEHIGITPLRDNMMFQFDVMAPGYLYRMHPDISLKQASMIIYLGDVGRGTILHNTERPYQPIVEVPYRPNTAVLFERHDSTLHSIDQRGISGLRYSLNMVHLLEHVDGGRALASFA